MKFKGKYVKKKYIPVHVSREKIHPPKIQMKDLLFLAYFMGDFQNFLSSVLIRDTYTSLIYDGKFVPFLSMRDGNKLIYMCKYKWHIHNFLLVLSI